MPSKITYIVIPLLIWLAAPANASTEQADPEFEALIEMPINDLMNVVVSVASLEDENLIESPAIVIRKFSFLLLLEL